MLLSQPPVSEQTVPSTNDLLLFMSKRPGGPDPAPTLLGAHGPGSSLCSLPGIILTLEGTSGGEVPAPVARPGTTQIPDPQALSKPFPALPQGISMGVRGRGLWPIRAEEGS